MTKLQTNKVTEKMNQVPLKNNSGDNSDLADPIAALDFSDDDSSPSFTDLTPEKEVEQSKSFINTSDYSRVAAAQDSELTEDDLAPEILIKEDGAISPREAGENRPADQTLTVVDIDTIGAGTGADEAELAKPSHKTPSAKDIRHKN